MPASLSGVFNLQVLTSTGAPAASYRLYTFTQGTTTHKTAWTDPAGLVAHAYVSDGAGGIFIQLNARGELPAGLFLASGPYDIALKTPAGATEWTRYARGQDDLLRANLADGAIGASLIAYDPLTPYSGGIGQLLNYTLARTAGEISASVIPVNFAYLPGDIRRYGALTGVTNDATAAFIAALASNDVVTVPPVVGGSYRITSTITITGTKTITGPDGGSQAFQHTAIYHDPLSVGELFNITSNEQQGVCIRNLRILGGNGTWAIKSSRSYCRYEYLHMEPYNGGGIQLLKTGIGSSSSKLINCQWVGPAGASGYTAFELDVNGGDVLVQGCTGIRGAIGLNIIQGQTIVVDGCSFNKQTRNPNVSGGPYSTALQFNTAGIKLSTTAYKEAITIRGCYLEALDNSVYVVSCESLTIEDNLFQDVGAAGTSGAWLAFGNSAINLLSSAAKNVTIRNNRFAMDSNGTAGAPFYGVYFNDAGNVLYLNNYYQHTGDNSGEYSIGATDTVFRIGNKRVEGTSSPVANADAGGRMRDLVSADQSAFVTPVLTAPWTTSASPVKFKKDALGFVVMSGSVEGGVAATVIFTLPVGWRPAAPQSYVVNANGAFGVVTVAVNGQVSFVSGAGAYVYLSSVRFSIV